MAEGMQAGEVEIKKAFEEVQIRNIEGIAAFTQHSRDMILEQNKKIASLQSQIQAQANLLNEFKSQLGALQAIVFRGGTL